MIWLTSLFLLLTSAALLWWNRPAAQWSGAAAARFAAALITALYAVLAPLQHGDLGTTQLLLEQLSLYAALPLLLSVALATSLGLDWSRMIWGRVLLVWCVVFELCRRNNVLPEFMTLMLIAGVLILILPLLLQLRHARRFPGALPLLPPTGWLVMTLAVISTTLQHNTTLWLGTALLLLFVAAHQRQTRPL